MLMDQCQDMVDKLSECHTESEIKEFESTYVSQRCIYFLQCFEDDFYGGQKPGAADISLFNVLNLLTRANIVQWKTEFPELLDHYSTIKNLGIIPKYLESSKDVPLGF